MEAARRTPGSNAANSPARGRRDLIRFLKGVERGTGYMSAVRQVENAGHWISRDALMAENIQTDDLTWPDFLVISWVERDFEHADIYHSATYYFQDFSNDTGKLMRRHWSSDGANETAMVGENIFYRALHPSQTKANYNASKLIVKLTAIVDDNLETKEYKILRRPNF